MNYNNIITGKDLDYLSDMFSWNYIAFKNTFNNSYNISDEDTVNLFNKGSNLFKKNMMIVLDVLEAKNE